MQPARYRPLEPSERPRCVCGVLMGGHGLIDCVNLLAEDAWDRHVHGLRDAFSEWARLSRRASADEVDRLIDQLTNDFQTVIANWHADEAAKARGGDHVQPE